jgi:peptidoglycan/xylan/chitin deacetylase (PgdA/CDA1 family)
VELPVGRHGLATAALCLLSAWVAPLQATAQHVSWSPPRTPAAREARTLLVPVLIYHHVKTLKLSDNAIERGLTVLPDQFRIQLQKLRSGGYHAISAAQVVTSLRTGSGLPPRPVTLTFDDGYADMYTNVYPLLRRLHMTATFFIVPGFLGTPRYLSWGQVIDMSRHGMDIEAHTLTHRDLTTLSPADRWHEIRGSRQELQQRLHRAVRVLAYPYGAYDDAVERDVARAGFYAAFTTHQGWILTGSQLLALPRVYALHSDGVPVSPTLTLGATGKTRA